MEESFELRVKRLFGSHLFDKVPTSSFPASSWSVAAGEVERQKWNRSSGEGEGGEDDDAAYAGDRADTPCSSAFYGPDGCFAKKNRRENPRNDKEELDADLDKIDDDDGDGGDSREADDERDVRSSIGLDPTLDREEEEDEHDRAAFGMDQATDRVYMSEVMDHGPHISIHSVVPEIYDDYAPDFIRDPRADLSAAMKRLKEDNTTKLISKRKVTREDNNTNLKPILKRKESQDGAKTKKRVRFGSDLKEEKDCNEVLVPVPVAQLGVPDYIRNPNKYTKYTFDSTDNSNDEETNKLAFQDLQNLLNKSGQAEPPEALFELPASVTFNPRRKLLPDSDAMPVDVGPTDMSKLCVDEDANESCEMDEDIKEERDFGGTKKPARQYRSKGAHDESA